VETLECSLCGEEFDLAEGGQEFDQCEMCPICYDEYLADEAAWQAEMNQEGSDES